MWRPLILRKYFHVSEGQRIGWTSYAVLTLRCERFSSVNKTEENLYIFNNGVCPHSMQHRPFSDLDISSARQGNPGTSRNQKIHHRVQNSQQLVPIRAKLITSETSDNISWRSILILFFHRRLGLASDLLPLSFLTKTLYVFLFSWYAPQVFPLRPSFI